MIAILMFACTCLKMTANRDGAKSRRNHVALDSPTRRHADIAKSNRAAFSRHRLKRVPHGRDGGEMHGMANQSIDDIACNREKCYAADFLHQIENLPLSAGINLLASIS